MKSTSVCPLVVGTTDELDFINEKEKNVRKGAPPGLKINLNKVLFCLDVLRLEKSKRRLQGTLLKMLKCLYIRGIGHAGPLKHPAIRLCGQK